MTDPHEGSDGGKKSESKEHHGPEEGLIPQRLPCQRECLHKTKNNYLSSSSGVRKRTAMDLRKLALKISA